MARIRTKGRITAIASLAVIGTLTLASCGGETTVGGGASEAASAAASEAASQGSSMEEGGESSMEASAEGDAAAAAFPTPNGGEVNLYNWTDYISPDLLKRFEAETGITVNLDNYDSNETLLAKLQAGGANYDVIVPSDYMVAQMIELGLLEQVAPSTFPNGGNIKDNFLDVYFDNGRQYTAPYMYGTTGIAVDPTKTSSGVTSWADFFAADNPAGPAPTTAMSCAGFMRVHCIPGGAGTDEGTAIVLSEICSLYTAPRSRWTMQAKQLWLRNLYLS
mgnify:CR=1 FL=1